MTKDQIILEIAQKHFSITTLESRNMDKLDFHEVSIWEMKDALTAAYEAGFLAAKLNAPIE